MATATRARRRLTDEQLVDLMALARDSDSVELKVTVPESDHASAVAALGMDPLDAQMRQVYFFDTPDLRLDASGLVARARRIQGRGDDSVVKLRPVVPSELPKDVRMSPSLGVEVDAMPGGYVCSASMKGVPRRDVRETVLSAGPIRKLFTKEQRAFYAAHAPDGLAIDELAVLGPINVFKLKFRLDGLRQRLVAELWLYPDTTRILELSTKCPPARALDTALEVRTFLAERGIDLGGDQQTKTKTALRYFSRHLPA